MAIDYETLPRKLLDRGLISNEKYVEYLDEDWDATAEVLNSREATAAFLEGW
jgi:hypothetical protein